MNKKNRIHDWRKLKWPFTVTFLYYSLLSLYTGTAEQSAQLGAIMHIGQPEYEAGKAAGIRHPENPRRPMTNFIR